MRPAEETHREVRLEEAQLTRYPALAEEAARMLLINRALATALIQLHSNHGRYVDLCRFLDDKVAAIVETAVRFELHEPSDESEDEEPPEWTGQPATCAGKTLKGSPCTRPGTLEHDGQPFCSGTIRVRRAITKSASARAGPGPTTLTGGARRSTDTTIWSA